MLAMAAARMGYRCHIFDPHYAPCAAEVAGEFTRAAFTDEAALSAFGAACDIVTYEFENLPVARLAVLGDKLRPGTRSLEIAQDRLVEKRFLEQAGARVAPWRRIDGRDDVGAALEQLGSPILLKTRRLGYDGKGQAWVHRTEEAKAAWEAIGRQPAVAEARASFDAEYSVILVRSEAGETRAFPISRNQHDAGILRRAVVPAGGLIAAQASAALSMAATLAEDLGHVGVMTVEFFACADGPVVNEIAPRVHNSGHWTIEGSVTSQFEQHIRAICGLPLRDTRLVADRVSMDNLIGGDVARWDALIAEPGAHVHLYNKGEARPGRKMGHVTRVE